MGKNVHNEYILVQNPSTNTELYAHIAEKNIIWTKHIKGATVMSVRRALEVLASFTTRKSLRLERAW